jgi:hypothetical protein
MSYPEVLVTFRGCLIDEKRTMDTIKENNGDKQGLEDDNDRLI